ncbi:hypothetical protein [Virgibacillus chiguensis]|uniref:hypothetical protein n=1 Tax=Virgibacillus chiguensis TaxID=411959 RepID=UPI0009323056|nr:hypothetical protein [Virgibacillus chiguensis]
MGEWTDLAPTSLELERTETMNMRNEKTILHTLRELQNLGIPVSYPLTILEPGYSSLCQIKNR